MPQGTIKTFDLDHRSATLLDDSLKELSVDAEAVAASGLLELRIGQRVRYEVEGSGDDARVTNLNIVSL